MKSFLTRACTKIFRFFWSWGFLKFVLVAITLIILLYAEEDWRGARMWAITKAKWETRGISFDPNSYVSPSIPDAENLAALPIFDPKLDSNNSLTPIALARALHDGDKPPYAPSLTHDWMKGRPPHFDELHRDIAAFYVKVFGAPPTTNDALAQWDAIYPFINELNSAAGVRRVFRLKEDYSLQSIDSRSIAPITSQIKVAKVLSVHAILALDENRPELAVGDIKAMLKISQGVGREPSLIAGLVSGGLCSIATIVINRGHIVHAWNDAQLAEIQAALTEGDMLAVGQHALRGECVVYSLPMIELLKTKKNLPSLWADGWVDQNLIQTANHLLSGAALIDPASHRIDVTAAKGITKEADLRDQSWTRFAPWNIFFGSVAGPITNAQRQFAHIQTYLDEGQIACGLERYRLAHGQYPSSIDALVPACIDRLPCDPINGRPYCYREKADGTFLLYSVGWNQKDDNGTAVFELPPGAPSNDSRDNYGDWVWPTPQSVPTK